MSNKKDGTVLCMRVLQTLQVPGYLSYDNLIPYPPCHSGDLCFYPSTIPVHLQEVPLNFDPFYHGRTGTNSTSRG